MPRRAETHVPAPLQTLCYHGRVGRSLAIRGRYLSKSCRRRLPLRCRRESCATCRRDRVAPISHSLRRAPRSCAASRETLPRAPSGIHPCTVLWLVVAHADDADGDGTRLQQLVEDGRHRLELEALAWFEGRRPLTGQRLHDARELRRRQAIGSCTVVLAPAPRGLGRERRLGLLGLRQGGPVEEWPWGYWWWRSRRIRCRRRKFRTVPRWSGRRP